MAALSSARNTRRRGAILREVPVYLKDGYTVYVGGVVCLDGVDGYAVPGSKATGLTAVGIYSPRSSAISLQGKSPVSAVDGDTALNVVSGVFDMDNGLTTDTVLITDVGGLCYLLDDHTVSRLSSGSSACGVIMALNRNGSVQVLIGLESAV